MIHQPPSIEHTIAGYILAVLIVVIVVQSVLWIGRRWVR